MYHSWTNSQRWKRDKKKSSRKKKDLAFKLMLEDSEVSNDEDITLTHKFKRFICSKGCFKRMENKEIAKRKEVEYNKETKKGIKKDKIKCYGCNEYGHMQNECSNKKDDKWKKVL